MSSLVSGSVKNVLGSAIQGAIVQFTLTGFGEQLPRVLGTNILAPLQISVVTDSSGNINVSLTGNDQIDPPGTLYGVQFSQTGGPQVGPYLFSIVGSAFDLDTAPLATPVPPDVPGTILNEPNVWSDIQTFPAGLVVAGLIITGAAPVVGAGKLSIGTVSAASATLGSNGPPPGQVAGYLLGNYQGTIIKIPYYNA